MYKIKDARISVGLTQKAVAQLLNVTPATYSRYENGLIQPDPETLIKIAKILNTSVDYILGEAPEAIADNKAEVNELLSLYRKMDDKFKIRLLGAAYAILAEQNINASTKMEITSVPAK